ncbi:unnamed protein product [Brachionus calyciflorus]|uniref:cGMP-dependent protein kinase interacting domain-containing protein n=1 Tax=Brachionus calyciflorus TaxID=104777 RepID=A0A813MNX7_9BILA|nr:unnamed protein product [Brachionus calyciflorus]
MYVDEANMQKQKKREEQIKRWKEREMSESTTIDSYHKIINNSKETKVKFPKSCIFLAACSSGDTDEVRQHLKLGVNINTTNIDGLTALHQACIDANLDMVKFLVENNADLNAQDNEGWTPLHAAVSVGNLEVTKYLLQKGARLDICNNDSDLPIDLCDDSNPNIKEYLEEEMKSQSIDAKFEKQKEELIMYEDAKQMNFKDKIHQKTGATPLHVSAAKGYLGVMQLLIQSGALINAFDKDGWTPLHAAAHWEQEEACRILAENGADFEAKNYSGQTPFDVCQEEMVAKLKELQSKVKPQQQKVETTPVTNQLILGVNESNRIRRQSDEISTKSSISRLTNEAKSSISEREKKQEKILLSPITTTNKPQFDLYEPENEKFTKESTKTEDEKENLNRIQEQFDPAIKQSQVLSKSNSVNKPKTGLHESLKSLSASVKLKMDEDKVIDFKKRFQENKKYFSIRELSTTRASIKNYDNNELSNACTTTTNSISPTNSTSSLNKTTPSTTKNIANLNTSNTNSTSTSNITNSRPHLERRWGNSSGQNDNSTYKRRIVLGTNGSSNQQTSSPSSSPTSTENPLISDLISPSSRRYSSAPIASKDEQAELIRKQKAKLERHFRRSTQAVSYEDIKSAEATIKGSNQTQPNSPVVQSENNNLISTNVISPNTASLHSQNILTTVPINSPPISQQGVSNLSSIFGETKKTNLSNSNLNTLTQINNNNNTNNESNDKDTIIANDIETDKLLDVIEKSKGFSDSNSTQANRRLRNRGIYHLYSNGGNDANDSNSLTKKINKLIWNEEKCEIEYKEKEDENLDNSVNTLCLSQSPSSSNLAKKSEETPALTSNSCHQITRPMYRFGQNDSTPGSCMAYLSSGSNRPGIKRSASQVPSTERRPVSSTLTLNTTPTTNSKSENESPIKDYQAAYELMKKENENLNQTILKLQKELEEHNKKSQLYDTATLDKREKRAIDRRISELEEEVKKVENLKQDNNRLKEENAALIRVISKLSK